MLPGLLGFAGPFGGLGSDFRRRVQNLPCLGRVFFAHQEFDSPEPQMWPESPTVIALDHRIDACGVERALVHIGFEVIDVRPDGHESSVRHVKILACGHPRGPVSEPCYRLRACRPANPAPRGTQVRAIGVLALVFGAAALALVGVGWRDRLMVAAGLYLRRSDAALFELILGAGVALLLIVRSLKARSGEDSGDVWHA